MKVRQLCLALSAIFAFACSADAVTLSSVGSDIDIEDAKFPGEGPGPLLKVSHWRSNHVPKAHDLDGNDVYGSAGYAMFATQYKFPYANNFGGSVGFNDNAYPNLIELPSFVASSLNLTASKVGGWSYNLIDDPRYVDGVADPTWETTVSPTPMAGQPPYVKLGILDGNDIFNNNPSAGPAGRWAFEIGPGAPKQIRVGVMTDGLDATHWAAAEVFLAEVSSTTGGVIGTPVSSGALSPNRYVDMHFFDIVDAQPGQQFAILATATPGGFGAISGVSFDVVPEPTALLLVTLGLAGSLACGRRRVA